MANHSSSFDVAVVGAGFGGLSSALTLQSQGLRTVLIDALDKVGGRAYAEEHEGYIFDRGPTIITAPFLIEEIFALSGSQLKDYVTLKPVDPFYDVVFSDGTHLTHWQDESRFLESIRAISPDDVEGVKRFFAHSEKIFQKGFLDLGDAHFSGIGSMLPAVPDLLRLDAVRSVYTLVSRFVKHPKVRQFLSFHPLLIGGNPFRAAAVYALINRLERAYGVHHAVGGMNALARAFQRRFEELGGVTRLESPVTKVVRQGENFVISSPKEQFTARRLVCNADMAEFVFKVLEGDAKPKKLERKLNKSDFSMSAFLIYMGTTKQWPELPQHSIVLGPRYKELIEDIFKRRVEFDDFSLYLHIPTRTDATLAPDGGEVVYALAPVPHLGSGTDWTSYAPKITQAIKDLLEERFLPGLQASIKVERTFTPLDFKDTLRSHLGNSFGLEPHLLQSAAFRPSNKSPEVEGLYFVGASTQPGAGLPGVILSSRISTQLLAHDAGIALPFKPLKETEAALTFLR